MSHEAIYANIELPPLVQQWRTYVLLDDMRVPTFFDFIGDILQATGHNYPVAAVGILSWFDNPHIIGIASTLPFQEYLPEG